MNFATIQTTWRWSWAFFKKENFVLFFLVSTKTWIRALTLILQKFWCLFIIAGPLYLVSNFLASSDLPGSMAIQAALGFLSNFLQMLIIFVISLSVRPSMEPKDGRYFKHYLSTVWFVNMFVIFGALMMGLVLSKALESSLLMPTVLTASYIMLFVSLFFFDSSMSIRDLFRAYKRTFVACLCFLPAVATVIIALTAITHFFVLALVYLSTYVESYLNAYAIAITLPIQSITLYAVITFGFSVVAMLYTKIKHEHFNLIFN